MIVLHIHWWWLPAILAVGAIVTLVSTPDGIAWFDFRPLLNIFAGLVLLLLGLGVVIGHYL